MNNNNEDEIGMMAPHLAAADLKVKNYLRAKDAGLIQCHCCGLLNAAANKEVAQDHLHCCQM